MHQVIQDIYAWWHMWQVVACEILCGKACTKWYRTYMRRDTCNKLWNVRYLRIKACHNVLQPSHNINAIRELSRTVRTQQPKSTQIDLTDPHNWTHQGKASLSLLSWADMSQSRQGYQGKASLSLLSWADMSQGKASLENIPHCIIILADIWHFIACVQKAWLL